MRRGGSGKMTFSRDHIWMDVQVCRHQRCLADLSAAVGIKGREGREGIAACHCNTRCNIMMGIGLRQLYVA